MSNDTNLVKSRGTRLLAIKIVESPKFFEWNIGFFNCKSHCAQFFASDFLISWFTWLLFILYDKKKHGVSYWWIPVIGNFCIGLSFSLSCYLYLREGVIDNIEGFRQFRDKRVTG